MAFPTTQPPNTEEIRTYIRQWLAEVSTSVLSDDVMDIFITNNISTYVDNLCKITYYSTVDCLKWLIRKQAVAEGTSGAAGAATKRREKNSRREIEVEYSSSGSSYGWQKILDDLFDNPSTIGCYPFSEASDDNLVCNVILGGADVNGYSAGFRTRDTFEKSIKQNSYKNLS
jgi:hypothetical protein